MPQLPAAAVKFLQCPASGAVFTVGMEGVFSFARRASGGRVRMNLREHAGGIERIRIEPRCGQGSPDLVQARVVSGEFYQSGGPRLLMPIGIRVDYRRIVTDFRIYGKIEKRQRFQQAF